MTATTFDGKTTTTTLIAKTALKEKKKLLKKFNELSLLFCWIYASAVERHFLVVFVLEKYLGNHFLGKTKKKYIKTK